MASVESANRYSAIEVDDDGNFIERKKEKKDEPAPVLAVEKKNNNNNTNAKIHHNNNNNDAAQAVNGGAQENKDRTRVSDRNRGPRGGRGRGNGDRGGFRPHRGGYIGDGEKREFDRRGAPGDDRPRGRPKKGGVGLGRFGDDEHPPRRNRPNRNENDDGTATPAVDGENTDASSSTATDAAAPVDTASSDASPTPDVASSSPDVAAAAVVEEPAVTPVEEEDTSLTYDEYQAQLKSKQVDEDLKRELRAVEINDKQWKKVATVLNGTKKKTILTVSGQEITVEEQAKPAAQDKAEKKKKVLSLDEFVGTVAAAAPDASAAASSLSSSSSTGGSYRGRGGRGGESRGRGGRGGSGFARGGARGGFKGPKVAIDDKNAFPDLSAAAKKN